MPSLHPDYEYDIFISYRQKDNKGDKWVTEFVRALKTELEATFKEDVSIYFDENPHDGLLEMHHVDKSLERKLKCLLFIPIISQTYCDPKSFAWRDEFCAFHALAKQDTFGRDIRLSNGNVASRILPVRIHDLDASDKALLEAELGTVLRSVDFIFKAPGVNRPLVPTDKKEENLNKTFYRDQVNKVANAVKEIITAIKEPLDEAPSENGKATTRKPAQKTIWKLASERGLDRVALVYAVFAIAGIRLSYDLATRNYLRGSLADTIVVVLALGLPVALWFAWRYEFSPDGLIRTSSAEARANPYGAAQKRPLTGNMALGILLVLLVAQLAIFSSGKKDTAIQSIAVLYFDNISNDPEQEVFSDGITEEITAHLSRIGNLRVTSRTSVLPYKGKTKAVNIRQIADELGVENILEGSVRRSGDKLRITAQLIEAQTDKHLWTEVYDREVTDIFTIQSEIARSIAQKFNLKISGAANAQLRNVPTANMEAYELYLKARSLPSVSGFGIGTYYGTTIKGVSILKKALQLDPDFSDAYLLLGQLYSELGSYDSAVLAVKEAIISNPHSAHGYSMLAQLTGKTRYLKRTYELDTVTGLLVLGEYFGDNGKQTQAILCYTEAQRRAPVHLEPALAISGLYNSLGRRDSALRYLEIAKALDPQSRDVLERESFVYRFNNNPEKWMSLAQRYYGEDSLSYFKDLGVVYLYARRWKDAEAAYARTNYRDMDLGLVMLKTNRIDSGMAILRRSLTYHLSNKGGWDGNLARIYAALGNRQEALRYYRKVLMTYGYTAYFQIDPFTDYIKDDPEFKQLMSDAVARTEEILNDIKEMRGKPLNIDELLKQIDL